MRMMFNISKCIVSRDTYFLNDKDNIVIGINCLEQFVK